MASIVDRPKKSEHDDLLKIEKYTNGLVEFIKTSETPITIGVQGEWGSGKTSLLNTIKKELCDDTGAKFYPVWINTWEYSLLSSPDETLIKIISGLVQEIGSKTKDSHLKKGKKATAALGSLIKNFGGFAGGIGGKVAEMSGEALEKYMSENPIGNSIKELRTALQEVIDEAISSNSEGKDAFIFFIDDLDRLDPAVAVQILELIKNLFDLEKCIFVLAIDYGVVVKGLQSKFGVMTEENEWEFRAFFDKIIQLPFSMPISSYNVSEYLKSLLVDVKYFEKSTLDNEEILGKIVEIVGLSVGTNPRALKRLANSVGLIEIIRGGENITADKRVIEFALVCIQVAYPAVYASIQKKSDFTTWDDKFALEILKNKQIDTSDLNKIKEHDYFNDPWEKSLWKICQINGFLKQNVYKLSELLNFIREDIPKDRDETIEVVLNKLLSMSSVTSVSAESNTGTSAKKKHTRLSSEKKKKIINAMQGIINDRVKNKYPNYFSTQSTSDFKITVKGSNRKIFLPVKIDNFEFHLYLERNLNHIIIYVNSKINPSEAIAWFTENMSGEYNSIKYNPSAKDGNKVVILDEYLLSDSTQTVGQYEDAIVNTFNKFLSKLKI